MKQQTKIIFVVGLILLALLIGNQLGLFVISPLPNSQNFTWNNINWTVYSDQPLNESLEESRTGDDGKSSSYYIRPDTNLEADIQMHEAFNGAYVRGMPYHLVLKSNDLKINYSNLNSLTVSYTMFCNANAWASGYDAKTRASLIDSQGNLIYINDITCNKESQQIARVLTKDSLLTSLIEPININEEYELYFELGFTKLMGNMESKVTLSNINIEYTPFVCNSADTNGDGVVDRTELGNYIVKWINGEVSRADLGAAIMAWVG